MISFAEMFGAFNPHPPEPTDFTDTRAVFLQKQQVQSLVSFLKSAINDYENISNSYKQFGKLTKQDDPKTSNMYYNKYNKARKLINKLAKIQHELKAQR